MSSFAGSTRSNSDRGQDVSYEEVLNTAAAQMASSASTSTSTNSQRDRDNSDGYDDSTDKNNSSTMSMNGTNININIDMNRPPSIASGISGVPLSGNNKMTEEEAAKLSSLPQRPIANFPSEGDRKRVIGCLATVISMMYEYENSDHSMVYQPLILMNEHESQSLHNSNDDMNIGLNTSASASDGELGDRKGGQTGTGGNHDDNQDIYNQDSWERSPEKKNTSEDNVHVDGKRDGGSNSNGNGTSSMPRSESNMSAKSESSSRPSTSTSTSTSSSDGNVLPSPTKQKPEMKLMIQRYKKRRHKIYSKLLTSAADFLYLDKSNAIAFLPLLNSLLDEDDAMQQASGIEEGPMMSRNSGGGGGGGSSSSSNNGVLREWNHGSSSSSAIGMSSSIPSDRVRVRVIRSPSRRKPSSSSSSISIKGTNVPPPPKQMQTWDDNDILIPFVESLEPGAGFQCLSLLLLNYLLQSEEGYDARIRACIKKLGVVILIHEIKQSECECEEIQRRLRRDQTTSTTTTKMGMTRNDILAKMATRKFESLEHTIASKLLRISAAQQQQHATKSAMRGDDNKPRRQVRRENIIKGIKIGSAGVAAGALFAVTGGLAAPGIAAGLAATGLTTGAITAGVVTTLTSTAAVTTIFGVGGGSLAAYKTHRRTKGVTEFEFQKQGKQAQNDSNENAELFSSICISGWIKDDKDFQRPWGVDPVNPSITDRTERLARFYAVTNPDNIPRCQEILKRWKGEERDLWALLRQKYGTDPDNLYPMYDSPYRKVVLTHEEDEIVDNLLGELGYNVPATEVRHDGPFHRHSALENRKTYEEEMRTRAANSSDISSSLNTSTSSLPSDFDQGNTTKKNMLSVWDYQIEYGGELLTVRWESDLLVELYDSVQDMAADLVGTAARELLKQTALSVLITAVALPYGLVRAANMIDGTWTLAIERADLAGIELARSLLDSQAGHRPVVLIGFSMGARTVYSCLKELARQQEVWESQQEELAREEAASKRDRRRFKPRLKRDQNKKKDHIQFLREPASIVEDAILMGLPNHLSLNSFEACRRIVAGRLVNCYSQKDLILSLMFQFHRLSGALRAVCGTSPVHVRGIENYDVSALVSAHSDYCNMTGHILRMIYHGCPHRSKATIVVPSEFSTEYSV
uniref:DUF726 domain-containing protein n=1 Tax=Chaetoceros debilis TaxID=122233 RepID=A0A7S3QDT7_9STRA